MKWRVYSLGLLSCFICLASANTLQAQITIYTWTGAGNDSYLYTAENWSGDIAPPTNNATTTHLVFGDGGRKFVQYYELFAQQLEITGNTKPYFFDGSYDTTHLGSGGLIYAPATPIRSQLYDSVQLEASQTWHIASGTFVVDGSINDYYYDAELLTYVSGNFSINKTGAGTLVLNSDYSSDWNGGLALSSGKVAARSAYDVYEGYYYSPIATTALGIGTLTFNGGTLVTLPDYGYIYYGYDNPAFIVNNQIVSNGLISLDNHVDTYFTTNEGDNYNLTLNADTTLQVSGRPLYVELGIAESGGSRKLTIDSTAAVILDSDAIGGTNTYTGGTHVANGVLIFADSNAVPVSGALTATANGYIGYASDDNVTSGFLGRFSAADMHGTIGFDSDINGESTTTITDAIDLTNFASDARLGSATWAIITNTITPQTGTDYRFGGGGGWLQVDSALTGARSLIVDSPSALPLTLRLTNFGNNYTNGTSVTRSGLIFADGSSPAGTGDININTGGYVGFEPWGDQSELDMINNSLAQINPASVGVVGFDALYGLTLYSDIDLSSFSGGLYLGTATPGGIDDGIYGGMTVTSTITPAGGASSPYRFAGYKGGLLEVASSLTGSAGVKIGDPTSPGTFADYGNEEYSRVALTGDNAGLSGDITLYGGQLVVGQGDGIAGSDLSTALGSGTLVVEGMTLPAGWQDYDGGTPAPSLAASEYGLIIPNDVTLNTRLHIGGYASMELSGQISGTGGLDVNEEYDNTSLTLTLSNDANDFSGGIYLRPNSTLVVAADHATGTGALSFGGSYDATVNFQTANPVIGGLSSKDYEDFTYLHAEADNTVLTVNQSIDSSFQGWIDSEAAGDAIKLVKTGTGTLRFDDTGLYYTHGVTGSGLPGDPEVMLQIDQGTLVIGQGVYWGSYTPTVWVHGGTLSLGGDANLYNPVVVDNGGQLGGFGNFASSVTLGSGSVLAPGFSPGTLSFTSGLIINDGATLDFEVQFANGLAGAGYDTVLVSGAPLDLSALSAGGFTLKVISLALAGAAGAVSDFDAANPYSWVVFDSTDGINGFDRNNVSIDLTAFTNSLTSGPEGDGTFFLLQNGNQLLLNFSPVPEPSTYALLALGLGMVWLGWRRRQRA